MIRSALRSLSYLVEGMVSVAKWAVGEAVAEIDYRLVQLDHRLQPSHVREGWAAAEALNDIEAQIDSHEPYAPYLQWGGPETWPQECGRCHRVRQLDEVSGWCQECLNGPLEGTHYAPYCNRCGYPHPTTQTCLRDQSSPVVPPTATGDRPAGVVADPPSAPPAGHPYYEVFVPEEDRVPTSELLDSAARMIGLFNRDNVATALMSQLRTRADALRAIENTT